jgi:WD40 repeat protein
VAVLAAAACVAVAGVGPLLPPVVVPEDRPAAVPEATPPARAAATADPQGDPLPDGALARLGTTRWRQGSSITYMAFGSNGNTLVTAGQDGTVRLWDMATGQEVRRFARPTMPAQPNARPVRPPAPAIPQPVPPARPGTPAPAAKPVPAPVPTVPKPAGQAANPQAAAPAVALPRATGGKGGPDEAKPNADADAKAEAELKARVEAARAQAEAAAVAARQQALLGGQGASNSSAVALSVDGKTIAVAGGTAIQLYEVETGNPLHKLTAPAAPIGLLFSPDGRTLAARAADGSAVLWSPDTGKERHRIKPAVQPTNQRTAVAALRTGGDGPGMTFTSDSKALVLASSEIKDGNIAGAVKFWDVNSGEELRELKGPLGLIAGVALSPDGKVLTYSEAGVVKAFKADTGDVLFETRLAEPAGSLLYSPDGKRLAVRGRTGMVRVCDGENGRELFVLGEPPTGALRGTVAVGGLLGTSLSPEVRNVAFSPDGQRVAAAAGGTIRVWSAVTGKELPLGDGHTASLAAVVLSPDGKTAVSWGSDGTIRRWDTATGKTVGTFRLPGATVAISADGRTVAASGPDGTIRLFNSADGREVRHFKGAPRGAAGLAFSPDGKALAERGADGVIRLYDPATGTESRQFASQGGSNPLPPGAVVVAPPRLGGSASASGLVFSPDGKLLAAPGSATTATTGAGAVNVRTATRGSRATITLYDVATGKPLRTIEPSVSVASFAFSPDGRVLATENADDSLSLWEVASAKERARLGGRPAPVQPQPPVFATPQVVFAGGIGPGFAEPARPATLGFSPDGRVLVARSADRSVRLWDVEAAKELGRFKGHDGAIETVAVSTDGKTVASGSADTTVLLWDAASLMKDMTVLASADMPEDAAEAVWENLAGADAAKAAQGVRLLATAPKQGATMLAGRLKPTAPVEPEKLARLVADLESERFAVRQEAATGLVKVGEQAIPALQKVLASQPTIEMRLRVEGLLDKLTGGTLTAEQLRVVRSVEALERMATPEAKDVLKTLAGGAAGALPTREAQSALDRLGGAGR